MAKKSTGMNDLDFGVDLGNVSVGKETCNLGCKISRNASGLTLSKAEKTFCERRLSVELTLKRPDEDDGQGKLLDDMDHQITAVVDVKRLGVKRESFSTSMTFSLAEIEVGELANFANRPARLVIHDVGNIPEDETAEAA